MNGPILRPKQNPTPLDMKNLVYSVYVHEIVKCTQAQYDALPIKEEKTLYLIVNP